MFAREYASECREALRIVAPEVPELSEHLRGDPNVIDMRLSQVLGAVASHISPWDGNKLGRYTIFASLAEQWGQTVLEGEGRETQFVGGALEGRVHDGTHYNDANFGDSFGLEVVLKLSRNAFRWMFPDRNLESLRLWQQQAKWRHDQLGAAAGALLAALPKGEPRSRIPVPVVMDSLPTQDLGDASAAHIKLVHNIAPSLRPRQKLDLAYDLLGQVNAQAAANVEQPRKPLDALQAQVVPTKAGGHRLKNIENQGAEDQGQPLWDAVFPATDDNVSATFKCPAHQKLRAGSPTILHRLRVATLNLAYANGMFD